MIDKKAPQKLVEMQKWFGKMVRMPFFSSLSEEESNLRIKERPNLKPHERIEIYHEQYWLRLRDIMQENFPFLTRLLGRNDFNFEIALPYLEAYPDNCPHLLDLGEHLPQWLKEKYTKEDNAFLATCAQIDQSYLKLRFAKDDEQKTFQLKSDLFTFRDKLLQHPVEYWNHHLFPQIEYGEFSFVLYRANNKVEWKRNLSA